MSMPRRLLGIVLLCALTAGAEVHQTYFVERTDVLDGRSLGSAGPYERIIANVIFRLDPSNEANKIITDIDLAPRNEEGLVEFSADLYVLKPRDPRRGNGTMLFDVLNRGRKVMLGAFNRAPSSLDPRTDAELGDGVRLYLDRVRGVDRRVDLHRALARDADAVRVHAPGFRHRAHLRRPGFGGNIPRGPVRKSTRLPRRPPAPRSPRRLARPR